MSLTIHQAIAIDWGNTNTVVIFKSDGNIGFLTPGATPWIPSYVQYDPDGKVIQIGWGAKNALRTGQSYVVRGTKRLLGRSWNSLLAAHLQKLYGLETHKGPNQEILVRVGPGLDLSAQQIARDFFSTLRTMILQQYPEEMLRYCVVTCPVQYLEPHKTELLQILREEKFAVWEDSLLPEPQAVCLLFPPPRDGVTLVIDWGGGTLDLALVPAQGRCIRLEGVEYGCGGSDMDLAILNALERSEPSLQGLEGLDREVLREWIEDRKERLLALQEGQQLPPDDVRLPMREESVVLNFQQEDVLQWIEPILRRAITAIRTSFWPHRKELRQCVLVGGPLQAPCLVQRVRRALPEGCQLLPLPEGILQTTAVARGALEAFRGHRSVLVHDYGVAVDLLGHWLGSVLLCRGQECPVESPKEILRPRGGPGTWVDVVVFARRADLSTRKYIYETSERFRILPEFQDDEAELEVQLIADSKGIVSLRIMDRKAHQSLRLQNLGQQLSSPLCGPPFRSYEEAHGGWLKHLWEKFFKIHLGSPPKDRSSIWKFLIENTGPSTLADLAEEAENLGQVLLLWINGHLDTDSSPIEIQRAQNTLQDHLTRLGLSPGPEELQGLLEDFSRNIHELLSLMVQHVGTSKVLPILRNWPNVPDLSFPIQRMEQIIRHFTGSEIEYRALLGVWAEIQPHVPPELKQELKECSSQIHKIVHFRYRILQLEMELKQT